MSVCNYSNGLQVLQDPRQPGLLGVRIPQLRDFIEMVIPSKRAMETDEVAAACVFLCSPSAVFVNGHSLAMDDGLLVGPVST